MDFNCVKKQFDDEWINNLCDQLEVNNEFTQRNKVHILESLKYTISKYLKDYDDNHFNDQRMAYLYVLEQIEIELEQKYYNNLLYK